jgi:hypothetical protein
MSERSFSRRRRGGMQLPQRRTATQCPKPTAQPWKPAPKSSEKKLDGIGSGRSRYEHEIQRSENLAAGLPPDALAEAAKPPADPDQRNREYREPHRDIPAEVKRRRCRRLSPPQTAAQGIGGHDSRHRPKSHKEVQRLIRPERTINKEIVINAESLETRVAILEDGKLEEFNIERTSDERLVGSIFKGKVKLEDGLKAALSISCSRRMPFFTTEISCRVFSTAALKSSNATTKGATNLESPSGTFRGFIPRAARLFVRSPKARSAPKARA